jgi:hypothetical protein
MPIWFHVTFPFICASVTRGRLRRGQNSAEFHAFIRSMTPCGLLTIQYHHLKMIKSSTAYNLAFHGANQGADGVSQGIATDEQAMLWAVPFQRREGVGWWVQDLGCRWGHGSEEDPGLVRKTCACGRSINNVGLLGSFQRLTKQQYKTQYPFMAPFARIKSQEPSDLARSRGEAGTDCRLLCLNCHGLGFCGLPGGQGHCWAGCRQRRWIPHRLTPLFRLTTTLYLSYCLSEQEERSPKDSS